MAGFFNVNAYKADRVRGCASCGLSRTCLHPQMLGTGSNERGILFLAEAPGEQEDKRGIQLIGEAGTLLRDVLEGFGWDLDRDCRKINAVNCRPPGNRTPTPDEIEACRRFVLAEIEEHKPKVIIPMGSTALTCLYGNRYSRELGGMMVWRGYKIPDQALQAWVCPTLHPSYILRMGMDPAALAIYKADLRAALGLLETPVPQYSLQELETIVKVFTEPDDAADWIERYVLNRKPSITAFDYETTGLKPQRQGHKIVTCAIATPEACGAFLVSRDGWDAVRGQLYRYLADPNIKKAVWNQQFEERWTKEFFDIWPAGIVWDGQLAAHVIDCRHSITSLKFQVAVNYGILNYESSVDRYKKPSAKEKGRYGENGYNTMEAAPYSDVAKYNGLDSVFTLKLAQAQRKIISAACA